MMKLVDYLNKILRGETINYTVFLTKLPKNEQLEHQYLFLPTKVADKQFLVEVLDQERFYQLIKRAEGSSQNRVDAAQSGDSHKSPTSFSHLLVFHEQLTDARPEVVVLHNEEVNQRFSAKSQLLIIENEENFFRYKALLSLLSDFAGQQLDLSNTDIVYGAGNQINKGLNFSFFEQYHSVFCAFDWDLGGLQMYKTLAGKLNIPVKFLLPADLTPWQAQFNYLPKSNQQWLKALDLAQTLNLPALVDCFKTTRRFLEQEVWLRDIEND